MKRESDPRRIQSDFGLKLYNRRIEFDVPQVDVAKAAGLQPGAYNKIERGVTQRPSGSIIGRLSQVLDIQLTRPLAKEKDMLYADALFSSRMDLDVTQVEVAKAAQIDVTTYNRYENGNIQRPRKHVRKNLAYALGLEIESDKKAASELADAVDYLMEAEYNLYLSRLWLQDIADREV